MGTLARCNRWGGSSLCDPLHRRLHSCPQHSLSLMLANNIDGACVFGVNIARRLSELITLKEEGNVSSVAVEAIDRWGDR